MNASEPPDPSRLLDGFPGSCRLLYGWLLLTKKRKQSLIIENWCCPNQTLLGPNPKNMSVGNVTSNNMWSICLLTNTIIFVFNVETTHCMRRRSLYQIWCIMALQSLTRNVSLDKAYQMMPIFTNHCDVCFSG